MPATGTGRLDRRILDRRLWRGVTGWTVLRVAAVALAAYAAWLAVGAFGRPYGFFDMKIYHGAMVWWVHGGDLYQYVSPDVPLGFTYPPFAAVVMAPMALLPTTAAAWTNVVLGLVALAAVLAVLLVPVADRYGWPRWFTVALAVPLAAALEPGRETLGYGQVNLLLFALVFADLLALRRRARAAGAPARPAGSRPSALRALWYSGAWAGVGVGLASAVKLTPGLFILYFLITRQWRAAVTAAGTAAAVTAGTFLISWRDSAGYWGSVLWQTERVGAADATPNQALTGLLARLYNADAAPTLVWITFALVILAVGLSRAANSHRDGDELAAFTLVGLTSNVVSPISWTHHLVYVIPAVLVLVDGALRRRAASHIPVTLRPGRPLLPGLSAPRAPIWFPALTGLRHASAAIGLYALFLISPIWPFEHKLSEGVSHYTDGALGALAESSFALALILVVAALPWRPGADPAFPAEPPAAALARPRPRVDAVRGS
ncbi:glycosyltransferase 87 family protein [Rhizomonospora bruguierae]|uniref:glycosyltransferase 87 family protein n=1 Tax=Rhizomonospora bruguierae TaxID=1581705 RepID=UPI001BD14768|nr:glycosyltransferase 87 family protein [Micromonospora sp. NBRC 107566]